MKTTASVLVTMFFLLFFFCCYINIWQRSDAIKFAEKHKLNYLISDGGFFTYYHATDTFSIGTGYIKFQDKDNDRDYIQGGNFVVEQTEQINNK